MTDFIQETETLENPTKNPGVAATTPEASYKSLCPIYTRSEEISQEILSRKYGISIAHARVISFILKMGAR